MILKLDKTHFLTLSFNEPFPDFSFNITLIEKNAKEDILRS